MDIRLEAAIAAFAPAMLWLVVVYTRDRYDREPKGLIARLFVGSIGAVIVAAVIENVLPLNLFAGAQGVVIATAIAVGLIEEGAKFSVAWALTRRSPSLNEPVDGMIYTSSVALGFAAIETTLYIIRDYHKVLYLGGTVAQASHLAFGTIAPMRAFTGALGHMAWAGLIGYAYGVRRTAGGSSGRVWSAYAQAALLHGAYDASLGLRAPTLAFIILAVSIVMFISRFHRAVVLSPFRAHQIRPTPASPPVYVAGQRAAPMLPPRPDAWEGTHRVPFPGLPAWSKPNPSSALMGMIPGGEEVRVMQGLGDWAHVLTRGGWTGWVDGRGLSRVGGT